MGELRNSSNDKFFIKKRDGKLPKLPFNILGLERVFVKFFQVTVSQSRAMSYAKSNSWHVFLCSFFGSTDGKRKKYGFRIS